MASKQSRSERIRSIIDKPYVKLPLILGVLLYAGLVTVYLFVAITSLYVLGTLLGVSTLQLLIGSVSAGSALASASAAILIWRGNVQARKTISIDRVLGPSYADARKGRELLESWKTEAKDNGLTMPFLSQVASEWRYYTLDPKLRSEFDKLQALVKKLEEQREPSKGVASQIVKDAAIKSFEVKTASTVYLWRSHSWRDGQVQGENGRQPNWELVVDFFPLHSQGGLYAHSLQIVDFNSSEQYSLPLLNEKKDRVNADKFDKFWDLARKTASENEIIVGFRSLWKETLEQCSKLERKLDSEIKLLK